MVDIPSNQTKPYNVLDICSLVSDQSKINKSKHMLTYKVTYSYKDENQIMLNLYMDHLYMIFK